jgi:hypothetical protein
MQFAFRAENLEEIEDIFIIDPVPCELELGSLELMANTQWLVFVNALMDFDLIMFSNPSAPVYAAIGGMAASVTFASSQFNSVVSSLRLQSIE